MSLSELGAALKASFKLPDRLRHEDLLAQFDREEVNERLLRMADTALQGAARLRKGREKSPATVAVFLSRQMLDSVSRNDSWHDWCYYNFLHRNHEYKPGVGLEFGNGPDSCLAINFWNGQDNRILSLGAVKFADIKKAPGANTTATWWRNAGPAMSAVVGHVYLLHVTDPRSGVDITVKFRVLELSADEWLVIEWQPVPQD